MALEACGYLCPAELEGLKLDMSILESRILSAILKVNFLTVKLKEMEAVVRHQDEMFCGTRSRFSYQ